MAVNRTMIGAPLMTYATRGGTYVADGFGVVAGVAPADVSDLLASGCVFGDAGTFPLFTSIDNLTAHAGGGAANATPVTATIARFTTVATAGDSALLPAARAGTKVESVINAGLAALAVFAAGNDLISGAASFSIPSGKSASFSCPANGSWAPLLSA